MRTISRTHRRPSATAALLLAALLSARATPAQTPTLPDDDRARIAEAFALARGIGDSVWSGWSRVPFAVLLVTSTHEFLVGHPRPSADFARVGYDSLLRSEVLVRPRVFPPTLLATFPAVGGLSTIVVGQPSRTGTRSTGWVLTLLHEHLHQLQNAQPGYFDGVRALGLARGDTTGMWMLNYPFPYDRAPVQRAFAEFARLAAAGSERGDVDGAALARAWGALRRRIGEDDARYLAFQLWQEGVARYTEYATATLAARRHVPTAAYAALPDVTSYADAATELRQRIVTQSHAAQLGTSRRAVVYPVGAALALTLDATSRAWREQYFTRPFGFDVLGRN